MKCNDDGGTALTAKNKGCSDGENPNQ